jgi:hypothetical protein
MGFLFLTGYGFLGASFGAQGATGAGLGIDLVMEERFAHTGGTFFILYMRLILIPKI